MPCACVRILTNSFSITTLSKFDFTQGTLLAGCPFFGRKIGKTAHI